MSGSTNRRFTSNVTRKSEAECFMLVVQWFHHGAGPFILVLCFSSSWFQYGFGPLGIIFIFQAGEQSINIKNKIAKLILFSILYANYLFYNYTH